jgi:hypothetical protein
MERVINPLTKKYINVNGPTYNKLLEDGYEASYLNSLKTINDLQLSNITTEPVKFNDDMMYNVIMYLDLPKLYALYHTSKYFVRLLNKPEILLFLSEKFDVPRFDTFNQFINDIIGNIWKHDYSLRQIMNSYFFIFNMFNQWNKKITECKTRRTSDNKLCRSKYKLRKDFPKEIDKLSASKDDDNYKNNLTHLLYAIDMYILSNYKLINI